MESGSHRVFLRLFSPIEPDCTFISRGSRIESSSGIAYFAKLGHHASDYEQWAGEAAALTAMHEAAPGIAPRLLAFGVTNDAGEDVESESGAGRPYFLSTYSDHGRLTNTAAIALGRRLGAEMHRYTSPNGKFGFEVPTYCGSTKFTNGWYDTWAECYSAMIGQMLGYLKQEGRFASLQKKGKELQER
jgi:protein-ribulosamine 3-kinase